jgi:hypothetical protein
MRKAIDNPPSNCLPPGANEEAVISAIESSGYPLQSLVADKLKAHFDVHEEWAYIDRESNQHRSLDVFAIRHLPTDPLVEPRLVLLIECKRSVHPFIFFKNVVEPIIPGFPAIAGLQRGIVQIREKSGQRTMETLGAHGLGIDRLPFIADYPPRCSAFSRATLDGKKAELSGNELFNSIVLPLVKAFDHRRTLRRVPPQPKCLFPELLIMIGVLDAPIILVESPHAASNPILTPWIRVMRQETDADVNSWHAYRHYGIEMVHIDYLDTFINQHLKPFADEFGRRCIQMANVLMDGGEVDNVDDWTWDQIRGSAKYG